MNKYLIIRFSSFGDIAQALPCASAIKLKDPSAEVHWLTRHDFTSFVEASPEVNKVWGLNRKTGIIGLLNLSTMLRACQFTHVYDAHSNLRSLIVSLLLRLRFSPPYFIRRPKNRIKRILLFWFRINHFPKPFRGVDSFLTPLKKWLGDLTLPAPLKLNLNSTAVALPSHYNVHEAIVLAPSATWELKRWPTSHWGSLAQSLPNQKFILLAGSSDTFCDEIEKMSPHNILNLRGQLTWLESTQIINQAKAILSGDTGLLHIADVMGRPAVAIIGPTAFGFPIRKTSSVAEIELSCRPCTKDGRGRCTNNEYQKCLTQVTPQMVLSRLRELNI